MSHSFSTHFAFDDSLNEDAKICVVGVGGGGGNAVNNMIEKGIHGVEFVAINTDSQALSANLAPNKIQAGLGLTKGLGAGARPLVGADAIEESREEIVAALEGFDMAFITAGMGGGTGTGGAPIVAALARELGILSVAIVTRPFDCEGKRRLQAAEAGVQLLRERVDTLIVIPNERLLDIAEEGTTLMDAFRKADEVLYNATRGISDLITVHGLINLDFADVRTTMKSGGTALMGAATASGENRAEKAAIEALSSPLLDGLSIHGATNVLVNITAGRTLGIREATAATGIIQKEAGDDVEVIFGTVIDDQMGDELRITVIATGFENRANAEKKGRLLTLNLDDDSPPMEYKGQAALNRLEKPAYERRRENLSVEPPSETGDGVRENPAPEPARTRTTGDGARTTGPARVRRLQKEDIPARTDPEPNDKDAQMPAFLRKMLD